MSISELQALIAEAEKEIIDCETAKKEIIVIVESSSNCVRELNCVSSNLKQGLVIDGKRQGDGVIGMSNKLTQLSKNMEANIQALDERIAALKRNIAAWKQEIARIEAEEARRAAEEAAIAAYRKAHPVKATIKSVITK